VKIVLDTNVILSSFLTEGIAHKIFNHCVINHSIYLSDYIVNELTRILTKKFKVKNSELNELLNFIESFLINVKPDNLIPDVCRDKNDNQILQLAEYIKADIIISGDNDLLVLKKFKNTNILSPRDFFNKHLIDKD
jgi:putative PIN family toxin of toxin-antitoxin system